MLSSHQLAKQACSDAAKQRTIAAHQPQLAAKHLHQLAAHQRQLQFVAHQRQHLFAAHQRQLLLVAPQLQLAANQLLRRSVVCFHVWAAARQSRTIAAATRYLRCLSDSAVTKASFPWMLALSF